MEEQELAQRMDKYIDDMDKQIKSIKEIAKDMGEMLNIIETIPEKIPDIKDLIERNCLLINSKISFYEFDSMKIKLLVKHHIKERVDLSFIYPIYPEVKREKRDNPSTSSVGVQTIDLTSDQEEPKEKSFSFFPNTGKSSTFKNIFQELPTQPNYVEQQWFKMKELYILQNTDIRYIDFTGIFPRIIYIQGNSAEEIRYW